MCAAGIFDRWTAEVRRWGMVKVCYRSIMNQLRPWLSVCEISIRQLDPSGRDSAPSRFPQRVATREELLRAADRMPDQLSDSFVAAALARGDVCYAIFDEFDEMAAFGWRSYSTAPHADGLWVGFQHPYRYGYKAYTLPRYRGQHIRNARALDYICLDRGKTHAIGFVELHNFPSIEAGKRARNQRIGYAGYMNAFGWTIPFRTRGARRHGFRFYRPEAEQNASGI